MRGTAPASGSVSSSERSRRSLAIDASIRSSESNSIHFTTRGSGGGGGGDGFAKGDVAFPGWEPGLELAGIAQVVASPGALPGPAPGGGGLGEGSVVVDPETMTPSSASKPYAAASIAGERRPR